jgi:hypothetical protein
VTEDLGRGQARAGNAVPRQRGGAHAAATSSRFRRKSASVPSDSARNAFPAAERVHLALLTAPVAGICAIAVAVTYRGGPAVAAAAIADAIALNADRGGRRWSRRTGPGLHRKAPDRGLDPGPGRNRDREQRPCRPGEVASGAPVPGTGGTLDHG